jgi:hypothetical protein
MATLIGDLLTLTKVGAQRSQGLKEFVNVVQIAREVIRSLQGEVRRKKLRSAVHLPAEEIRFWIVPGDLTQIFLNLLSNAVKFTPPRGRVDLAVTQRAGGLEIRVSDTGVGIAPSELSKIFDEFYHLDHPEVGASQGSGLGLAIVKRITTAYQGKVTVLSRVGRGSRFQVVFPLRSERQVLQAFLVESWDQARQAGQAIGLVFCQVRIQDGKKSLKTDRYGKALEILEKTLRDGLRKEDRIFRFSPGSLLAVLTVADSRGLSMAVRRLEDVLRKTPAVTTLVDSQKMQWRLVGMVASRRDTSPTRFLEASQARLKEAWGKHETLVSSRS